MSDRDSVVRELRTRLVDARGLCAALQLQTAPRASARQAIVLCPWHAERSPSCSVRLAKDGTIAVKCHACGESADALGLIAQVHGVNDFRDVLRLAAELANAPSLAPVEAPPKPRDERESVSDETYHQIWTWILEALSPLRTIAPHVAGYLDARCIGADAEAVGVRGLPRDARTLVASLLATFERKDLEGAGILRSGHDALDWREWCVVIPWRNRFGLVTFVQRRRLDTSNPKYRSPRGRSPQAPFGVDLLREALALMGPDAEIILTEGAFAALARWKLARRRAALAAVIGVYSASSPDVGLPLDLLEGRRVVLSLDKDAAGERAREKLVGLLEHVAGELVHERPRGAAVDAGDVLERLEALT
jgi:DNA primase